MTDAYQGGLPADQVGPPPKTASATIRPATGPQDAAGAPEALSGTQRLHDARVARQVRLALDLATVRAERYEALRLLAEAETDIEAMVVAHDQLTAERDRARDTAAQLEAEVAICNALIPDLGRMAAKAGVLLAERDAARAQVAAQAAVIEAVRALHADGGVSYRYFDSSGYGSTDHACLTCRAPGDHAVRWPCPTAALLPPAPEPEPAATERPHPACTDDRCAGRGACLACAESEPAAEVAGKDWRCSHGKTMAEHSCDQHTRHMWGVIAAGQEAIRNPAPAAGTDTEEGAPWLDNVWREGDRIRHTNGTGYNDRVTDEEIRAHLEQDIVAGYIEGASFAAATLALRTRERRAPVKAAR